MDSTPAAPTPAPCREWDEFILLVSSREGAYLAVQNVADALGCTPFSCASVAEAREYLQQAQFLLVICDENLPEGDWSTLLAATADLPYAFGLVVISESYDCRQRTEELNLRGYDIVVVSPGPEAIRRVVNLVAARWRRARAWADTGHEQFPAWRMSRRFQEARWM